MKTNNPAGKDNGLEILPEDDEISDLDGKCKEYCAKILQLEDCLKASKDSEKKVKFSWIFPTFFKF